jgi:hypothetical protein
MIVRGGGQMRNGLENLLALARKDGGDLRRQPVEAMAGHTNLNHLAGPRRRA